MIGDFFLGYTFPKDEIENLLCNRLHFCLINITLVPMLVLANI